MQETPHQLLKRMIVSAINAREVENARVSRLLHDQVGQVLSAVGLQLDVLKLDYRGQIPEITERVHEIQKVLDQAVEQVRTLSYDLNPSIVERAGLHSALDRLVGRFRTYYKSGSLRFIFDPGVRVPLEIGNIWYRIAELALENAVQHAEASLIEVHVRATAKNFVLEIRDDGKGFSADEASHHSGIGLLLMEHYSSQVPITVDLRSKPGKGTIVKSTWLRTQSPDKRSQAGAGTV